MIPVIDYRATALLLCRRRLHICRRVLHNLRYHLLLGLTIKAALSDILRSSGNFAPLAFAFVSCGGLGRLNRRREFERGQAGVLLLALLLVHVVGERVG